MATAKSLQTPRIIEILGSTIRIAHPDIRNNIRTALTTGVAAAGASLTVQDNNGFANADVFIIGEIGDSETESGTVNNTVTRGTSLSIATTLKFSHSIDTPVTKINETKITIYGAATDGGTLTAIKGTATAVNIEWNKQFTEYTLITTDTAYNYYVVKFYDGTTESSASGYMPATGVASNMVEYWIQQALTLTNTRLSDKIHREDLIKWADDAQSAISQFTFQDPRSGEMRQSDWDFETYEDTTSLTITENENQYNLESLTPDPKYLDSHKAIIDVRIGDKQPLTRIEIKDYDNYMADKARTQLSVAASAGDTTLTVDSNAEFASSGTLLLGTDQVTYTGKSGTTGFTGIPASGTGSITATRAIDSPVWQGVTAGLPEKYTVFAGSIYLNLPPSDAWENYPLKVRYFKKLASLTDTTSTTDVNFTHVFQYYLASVIEERKGAPDRALKWMNQFRQSILENALSNIVPISDENSYYNYENYLPTTTINRSW